MSDSAPSEPASSAEASLADGSFAKLTTAEMCARLLALSGVDIAGQQQRYETFAVGAHIEVGNSTFFAKLNDLRDELAGVQLAGKIRGIEAWADGNDAFKHVYKSWDSFVDKLYRINIEENDQEGQAPLELTVDERTRHVKTAASASWVSIANAHEYVDDIVRTKFVLPFADGVEAVSTRIKSAANELGLPNYRRYHAKDSGYHAHHVYVAIPVLGPDGGDISIAFEIKVLTKLQDTLGELTHQLYELKRIGRLTPQKKRKLAWMFDDPDFTASYVGHTAHYMEASLVRLKAELDALEGNADG